MKQFHQLKIASKRNETRDSVRFGIAVPDELRTEYSFLPGQHLPLQVRKNGRILRRTYSICSQPGDWPLEIGVRIQPGGAFSEYASGELAVGDDIEVMPPAGGFHVSPEREDGSDYLAFAAGSGITPILSIVTSLLREEPTSRIALFYGNRKQSTTMFIDDLFALKNLYPERLQLQFVFSQEDQEFPIAAGRLDGDKVSELVTRFCAGMNPSQAFICGPDTMIESTVKALGDLGFDAAGIHSERFGVPRKGARKPAAAAPSADVANITIIMDGHKKSFEMTAKDPNIVDAAAEHGIDLPYSCKGGVCATCRCHVREGEVDMAINYGLEPWEVDKGFALACQSRPVSKDVLLDYDKT
jgi:ring-1,2-phenylacetyl-CoA epoxidase subunit PaaE